MVSCFLCSVPPQDISELFCVVFRLWWTLIRIAMLYFVQHFLCVQIEALPRVCTSPHAVLASRHAPLLELYVSYTQAKVVVTVGVSIYA